MECEIYTFYNALVEFRMPLLFPKCYSQSLIEFVSDGKVHIAPPSVLPHYVVHMKPRGSVVLSPYCRFAFRHFFIVF